MNRNKYNEIINGKATYKTIANDLINGDSVIIGWTDEKDTHYNILFNLEAISYGNIHRGITGRNWLREITESDLFVSIISIGSYGFETDTINCPGYIEETLFKGRDNCPVITVVKITELINGVIEELIISKE